MTFEDSLRSQLKPRKSCMREVIAENKLRYFSDFI